MNASDTDLALRRNAWREIFTTLRDNGLYSLEAVQACTDARKVAVVRERCSNIAAIYASLTGDDSLFPPLVQAWHKDAISAMPQILSKANRRRVDKERGVVDLFAL